MSQVQISAGRGPREARDFVAQLVGYLVEEVEGQGGRVSELSWGPGRRSVRMEVWGADLSGWVGTHELVAPVRGRGQRRRWYVGLTVQGEQELAPFDGRRVRFSAAKAGGPGGQHVNTTCSAVRAVYEPTGWEVRVTSERSQHRNRAEALRRLRRRHQEAMVAREAEQARGRWRAHEALVRGAPVRRWRGGGRLLPEEGR